MIIASECLILLPWMTPEDSRSSQENLGKIDLFALEIRCSIQLSYGRMNRSIAEMFAGLKRHWVALVGAPRAQRDGSFQRAMMNQARWVSGASGIEFWKPTPLTTRKEVGGLGTSCWLYLSEPDHEKPIADCWLYNRVPAPEVSGSEASRGSAPPASAQYTGAGALMSPPRQTQVSLRWSRDGESVAAFFDRELAGFIVGGQARGFSRHLVASGPWGSPLDSTIFKSVFADDDTAQPRGST